jgi:hypothetical protein
MAPDQSAPNNQNLAYIFFSRDVIRSKDKHLSFGKIFVDPDQSRLAHKQYWRLQNISLGGILPAVILRSLSGPSTGTVDDELKTVRVLYDLLESASGIDAGPSGEDHGEDGGCRCGGGCGKGRRRAQKQAAEERNTRITRSSTKRNAIAASS